MSTNDAAVLDMLMTALERDDESCWALYEEIGRIAVARWLASERNVLLTVARAWVASSDAQGALSDSWPNAADHAEIAQRAEVADAELFARIGDALACRV
ncbi:hypothetical protein DM48_3426 [Burkholderia gladioli]|uniref:Uncharacterized protein n=1 Tax=Burkholderia gladioli TaxID=28095 RepID=A0AAW3F670_BURGA|nr:hypothetical protein [Burkholderia gladioli]KGC16449.1 hypothetical protein DM48_3426 [Burkholderia gladioli]